ncbi:hypothetical protein [Streptomyces prasinopilosus]|uniref:hypothetical protein n=1 Tax=Streptomyces prasinopilosus TaxID=67344 RepID=UPI00099EC411
MPTPARRRSTGAGRVADTGLVCDGRGTPLTVITTAANANDVTQTLALLHRFKRLAVRRERWVGVGLSGPCTMA